MQYLLLQLLSVVELRAKLSLKEFVSLQEAPSYSSGQLQIPLPLGEDTIDRVVVWGWSYGADGLPRCCTENNNN